MRRWCKTMSFFLSGMSVLAGAGTVLSAALAGTLPAHGTTWDETRFVHYSSANTPAVFVSPNALGTITRVEDSGGLVAFMLFPVITNGRSSNE